jgi:hypothetical protein
MFQEKPATIHAETDQEFSWEDIEALPSGIQDEQNIKQEKKI